MTHPAEEIPFGEVSMHDAHLTVSTDAGSPSGFELSIRGSHRIVADVLQAAADAFREEADR